jgi:hypothetical protein
MSLAEDIRLRKMRSATVGHVTIVSTIVKLILHVGKEIEMGLNAWLGVSEAES